MNINGPYDVQTGAVPNPIGALSPDFLVEQVAGCLAMLDVGHVWGYPAQTTPIATGTLLNSYVDKIVNSVAVDGNTTTVNGAPSWAGNMMLMASTSHIALLPVEWKLATSVTDFAFGGYFKIPKTGYPSGGTGGTSGVSTYMGYVQTNGSSFQWGLQGAYDKGSGALTALYAQANGTQFNVFAFLPADGAAHHYVIRWKVLTGTTAQISFYVDGTLVATSGTLAYAGSLVQPSSGAPALGANLASALAVQIAIGRVWLWDLTVAVAAGKSITDLIAADITQNTGRFL